MEQSVEQPRKTVVLPARLADAFKALRKGRHLCRTDGPVWFDLREHADDYRVIFSALGYTLADHPRGFYYFAQGQQARPDILSRLVYFFACLFADLEQGRFGSDQGRWVDALTDQTFDLSALSQSMFAANDRQRVFDQLGVTKETFEKVVIAAVVRYGIATKPDSGRLRFRESVYRFVELFQICGSEETPSVIAGSVGSHNGESEHASDSDDDLTEGDQ